MAADWLKIKSEYVSGNVSYRELSEKYGVSQSVIRKRAAAEKWTGTKTEQRNKIRTELEQKTVAKVSDALSDEAAMKVQIRSGLFRLAADWISKQEVIEDTAEYRRMVQSCVDLGILEAKEAEEMKKGGIVLIPQVGGDA